MSDARPRSLRRINIADVASFRRVHFQLVNLAPLPWRVEHAVHNLGSRPRA